MTDRVGEYRPQPDAFVDKKLLFSAFAEGYTWKQKCQFFAALTKEIQGYPSPCFLLPSLVSLFYEIGQTHTPLHINEYELWLNLHSGLDDHANRQVRGKIAGRYVPREAFQKLFPVGMGKYLGKCHYVSAHKSPDLDTITASFLGWLDAFACRVGETLHKWNIHALRQVPQISHLFSAWIGKGVFDVLGTATEPIALVAEDLLEATPQGTVAAETLLPGASLAEAHEKLAAADSIACIAAKDDSNILGYLCRSSLEQNPLGTLSMRDFCNKDEAPYSDDFTVVSVLDHHRVEIATQVAPTMLVADVQSSNVLTLEASWEIDALYARGEFFTSPKRAFVEQLLALYAIFDDTDLLAKMTPRDLLVVKRCVNELKSLSSESKEEVFPLISAASIKEEVQQLLCHPEMYSLYKPVYALKEEELAKDLQAAAKGQENFFFADTKEQKGVARVGQAKLFPSNIELFMKLSSAIRRIWLEESAQKQKSNPSLQLHVLMISTLGSAEELYKGGSVKHQHEDELWLHAPQDVCTLAQFLDALLQSPTLQKTSPLGWQYVGMDGQYEAHRALVPSQIKEFPPVFTSEPGVLILKVVAGSVTSRKSQVTPFLPS